MDPHTLLLVGFVVVTAGVFVAARVGAAALGVLPAATGAGGADTRGLESADEPDGGASAARGDAGRGASRITADDRERIRTHLENDPSRRSPDDLLPSDAEDETE